VVPRDSDAETFVLALIAVARGLMFFPGDWLNSTVLESRDIKALSARQREFLQMLAAGESNNQIGRALNISTGTVKAHL
uniref:LuxR C-terminal-related transcriptional regulator n=1 Tax=Salmonella enterica TaxID=28901 RepID=UPI0020C53265